MKSKLHVLSLAVQDSLLAAFINNSLILMYLNIRWRAVVRVLFCALVLIGYRILFEYTLLDYTILVIIVLALLLQFTLIEVDYKVYSNRSLIFVTILIFIADYMYFNFTLSGLMDMRYSGYHSSGRNAGMSREPSYFAEYLFLIYIVLFVGKRYLVGVVFLAIVYFLTLAATLLQYLVFFHAVGFFLRITYLHKGALNFALFLVLLGATSIFIDMSGYANWTFYAQGSLRTISNNTAFLQSGLLASEMSSFGAYGMSNFGLSWLTSIYSYGYSCLYSLGYPVAILLFYVQFYLFRKLIQKNDLGTRASAYSIAGLLIYFLFSPKWHFILLTIPIWLGHKRVRRGLQ